MTSSKSPASLKKRLLTFLSTHQGKPLPLKSLLKHLKLKGKNDYRTVRNLVDEFLESGLLQSDAKGRISYVGRSGEQKGRRTQGGTIVGRLSVTKRGFGFVKGESMDEEIMISPKFMKTAFDGDLVAVVPFARQIRGRGKGNADRLEGEIVEILERTVTTVVGRLEQSRHFHFVVPDNRRIPRDIYIPDLEAERARHGDKVLVRLLPWDDEQLNPEGTIIEVLGRSGDSRAELLSVARGLGLQTHFPPAVEQEAKSFSPVIAGEELRERIDYRKTVCVTIDPEDAKDFDDAVSLEHLKNGNLRLGVHIADVSHYVREGSALDAEALRRGTSIYMVNEVIPMLPERLSNDLCSLVPHADRRTYSVLLELTPQGKVVDYEIGKSLIRSARRFTYEEVQKIIESNNGDFADIILPLYRLTQKLMMRRRKRGSIDFDTPEAKFEFDRDGLPSRIVKKERLDAHRLIEECMLLANMTVAEHIGRTKGEGDTKPLVFRVHDAPDPSRLEDLASFVKQFGYSLNTGGGVTSRSLQKLLDKVKGTDVEVVINEVALRSMAKAVYSTKNIGHFGLALSYYTHFTSPIRRYPDLVVHRLLAEYAHGASTRRRAEIAERLPEICKQCSDRERVAIEAERNSVKVMQVEYMKRHIGDEFEGVIGGVTNFGLFVEINDLLVEGLVKVRDMLDDYYLFDEKRYTLTGRSRRRTYRLGDKIRVQVISVNPEEREIDFTIVE